MGTIAAGWKRVSWITLGALLVAGAGWGCAGGSGAAAFMGSLFPAADGEAETFGPVTSGRQTGGGLFGAETAAAPCEESQDRKFVRVSMRNLSPDYVHYFMILIAFIDDPATAEIEGAVCPDDISLYTSFGYVRTQTETALGHYCIPADALYYFHENGRFQGAGAEGLASAIRPADGTTPSYDSFFTSSGARVPIPNVILFHNPGTTTEGRALKFANSFSFPCSGGVEENVDPDCSQDAFYYVDSFDFRAGPALPPSTPAGSSVRYPSQIQGTGCECGLSNVAWSVLAPPGRAAADAQCNEFFRGGRIDYVFIRDDAEPPFPQAVWRVTNGTGTVVHEFDPRANVQ